MVIVATLDLEDEQLGTQVTYAARAFGLTKDQIVAVPPSGIDVVVVQPKGGRYVQGESCLTDFEHPEDCCYLFGASHALMHERRPGPVASVYIPAIPSWDLFTPQAVAIVLYDRMVKGARLG